MTKKILKGAFRAISLLIIAVTVLIAVFNITSYIKRLTSDEQLPLVLGFGSAIVLTGSMEPNISAGDLVVIHRQDSYKPNQVVTYEGNTTPVTHRVIAIGSDENGGTTYLTQGDANNTDDGYIPADRIIGRVILVIPNVGGLQNFLTSPMGFTLITLALGAMLFAPELINKSKNSSDEQTDDNMNATRLRDKNTADGEDEDTDKNEGDNSDTSADS